MADASSHQANFQGGEWSRSRQGRVDDPRYKAALATCLNYIPTVEGNLKPRSGFWHIGQAPRGKPADLLPFRFSSHNAYVLEYTSNAFVIPGGAVRLWANGTLIIKHTLAFTSVSVGGTPTFTMSQDFPADWNFSAYAQSCLIHFDGVTGMEAAPHLVGRDFFINITGANTCTLKDTLSGSVITTPVTATFTGSIYLAFQMVYNPATLPFLPVVGGHKILEYTSQRLFNNGTTASAPDQRAVLLSVFTPPIVFSSAAGITNPKFAEFIDGPYLDSAGPDTPVGVSGTTGDITVTLFPYVAARKYLLNEVASDGTDGFASLVNLQVGHALPATASAYWAKLPIAWSGATTYVLGAMALGAPTIFGVSTIYYSKSAGNINHALTNTAYWSLTPPLWLIGTTYAAGIVIQSGSGAYWVSIQAANVGNTPGAAATFWVAADFTSAVTGRPQIFSSLDASDTLSASDAGYPGYLLDYTKTGRVIRLKCGARPWSNLITYSTNDLVNFQDDIYKALASNTNKKPDTDVVNWEVQTTTIQWTWGIIKTFTSAYTATVTIKGDDLVDTGTVYEYRLGLFSSSTGWPNEGTYHEGRLVLSGGASGPLVIMGIPNRIDFGQPDQGFSFSPTAPDGTVSDGNGIAMMLNSSKSEVINGLTSTVDGVMATTDTGEWIIAASNLNDPLTPTSVQAKKATTFGSAPMAPIALPSSHIFIQNGFHRLIEHKSFMDATAYQVRPNGSDLTRDCQHLTAGGIASAAYQAVPQPIIWCLKGRFNETACNEQMTFYPHRLFGIGCARSPDETYVAPFSAEHGYDYFVGRLDSNFASLAVQYGAGATKENLYVSRSPTPTAFSSDGTIEMMEPVLDTSGPPPSEWRFIFSGHSGFSTLTDTQKMMASGCFLDKAISPVGVKIAADSASATFYGLWVHAGQSVDFVIMGKYIGNFLISATGTVNVPFSNGASTSDAEDGDFSMWDVVQAMVSVPTEHAYGYQEFVFDNNSSTWGVTGYDIVVNQTYAVTKFCGYFGYRYRRRGKTLRPLLGSQNGITPFAKTKRNFAMALDLEDAHEVSIGSDFTNVQALSLTVDGSDDITPLEIDGLASGTFRDNVISDYDFDGQLAWEATEPYPGGILGVGGFYGVSDL